MKLFLLLVTSLLSLTSYKIHSQEWQKDIDTAQTIAIEKERPIILVFQGSDWCAPCIKLDEEIFQSEQFKLYAKDHFVMLEADFPRREENKLSIEMSTHNTALLEKFNPREIFPFVVVLDKDLNVLGETGYYGATPTTYILELDSFTR